MHIPVIPSSRILSRRTAESQGQLGLHSEFKASPELLETQTRREEGKEREGGRERGEEQGQVSEGGQTIRGKEDEEEGGRKRNGKNGILPKVEYCTQAMDDRALRRYQGEDAGEGVCLLSPILGPHFH